MTVQPNYGKNSALCKGTTNQRLLIRSLTLLGEERLASANGAQLVFVLLTVAVIVIPAVVLGHEVGDPFAAA